MNENRLNTTPFQNVNFSPPQYFFIPKDFEESKTYEIGFSTIELFQQTSLGVLSKNDDIAIDLDKNKLCERIKNFQSLQEDELRTLYKIKKDSRDWVLTRAISDLKDNYSIHNFKNITYRPFDNRWTYFTGRPKGFFAYSQNRIMKNMIDGESFALILGRQGQAVGNMQWNLSFITNNISDQNIYSRGGGSVFPLYIYADFSAQKSFEESNKRTPNLDPEIVKAIADQLKLEFLPEEPEAGNVCLAQSPEVADEFRTYFTPLNLLDYIYAVLHSPSYRDKYKEFLKIDFPRVPYPKDSTTFWQLVKLGGQIRQMHLMNSDDSENYITSYPIEGDHLVSRKMTKTSIGFEANKEDASLGKVWINDKQYFDDVPELAWDFYIGGYQPAQKWLKDRQGRNLSFDDILHYQKIIVALAETDRLMKEIDKIDIE